MSHTVSYRCYFCKQQRFTTEGAKFVQIGRYKRRMCKACVEKRRDQSCAED